MPAASINLTIGHSPDADDAFMWWPLGGVGGVEGLGGRFAQPRIDTEGLRFTPVPLDISELNARALESADLDITALSMHCFAHAADRYALTSCGWSMGDGYGPKVVAREPHPVEWLLTDAAAPIAIPGDRTSAFLALRLMLGAPFRHRTLRFDAIIDAVAQRHADAGVIIHDGQISYRDSGLVLIADLGEWWTRHTGLPLPLGANAIRRDLDRRYAPGTMQRVTRVLKRSIEFALSHRAEGLDYAMQFAPGASRDIVDRFVGMYVNDLTVDAGEPGGRGVAAVRQFLAEGARAGFCPLPNEIEVIRP